MVWINGPLALYHGTDEISAHSIIPSPTQQHAIQLKYGYKKNDFGSGFYTTTNLQQAKHWANKKALLSNIKNPNQQNQSIVLKFTVDRWILGSSQTILSFVRANHDFWEFVIYCRQVSSGHLATMPYYYDIVFGPVSKWPQNSFYLDTIRLVFTLRNLCIYLNL